MEGSNRKRKAEDDSGSSKKDSRRATTPDDTLFSGLFSKELALFEQLEKLMDPILEEMLVVFENLQATEEDNRKFKGHITELEESVLQWPFSWPRNNRDVLAIHAGVHILLWTQAIHEFRREIRSNIEACKNAINERSTAVTIKCHKTRPRVYFRMHELLTRANGQAEKVLIAAEMGFFRELEQRTGMSWDVELSVQNLNEFIDRKEADTITHEE